MRSDLLRAAIEDDREKNNAPFLVVATAGATNTGVIDNIAELGADRLGGEPLVPRGCGLGRRGGIRSGIAIRTGGYRASAIPSPSTRTNGFPSRWAPVFILPGMQLWTRHFASQTAYMPKDAESLEIVDPHLTSMQWSRRFNGIESIAVVDGGRLGWICGRDPASDGNGRRA